MNKAEALLALVSEISDQRLRGARYFAKHAISDDLPNLKRALLRENVRWIKRALESGISHAQNGSERSVRVFKEEHLPEEVTPELIRSIQANAVDEVARTILHEFSPLVGALRLVAAIEVENFDNSKTRHFVEQLGALLTAVRNLKQAASTPTFSEFDLAELVSECLAVVHVGSENITVRLAGIRPYMVMADRNSMSLSIINGLRNALEAVAELSVTNEAEILINWGPAGVENWLAILDSGPGFPGNPKDALKLGSSNKQDHFGYGLTIAQLAIRAMEGELYVSNKEDGGARFELRWYKEYADTLRRR